MLTTLYFKFDRGYEHNEIQVEQKVGGRVALTVHSHYSTGNYPDEWITFEVEPSDLQTMAHAMERLANDAIVERIAGDKKAESTGTEQEHGSHEATNEPSRDTPPIAS